MFKQALKSKVTGQNDITKTALLFITILFSASITADTLKPFVSDGCSAFPDGTFQQNELWLSCCIEHDYAYYKGGTYQERLESDKKLATCVANIGQPSIGLLMLLGVRVGGGPYFPTKFRWGYGWSYPRLYRPLTDQELKQIKDSADQASQSKSTNP